MRHLGITVIMTSAVSIFANTNGVPSANVVESNSGVWAGIPIAICVAVVGAISAIIVAIITRSKSAKDGHKKTITQLGGKSNSAHIGDTKA
jgi:hypothetical protein